MIEILILYILSKREKTIYSIRKEIIEIFGAYTKPSIGTIHPALKRLLKKEAVSVYEKMSDGGKKSSYFSMAKKGLEVFKEYFFSDIYDNPSLFYTHLHARLTVMGLLSVEERKTFISDTLKKLEINKIDIESKLKDEYLELDYYQRQTMTRTLNEYKTLSEFIKQLKVDNAG